MRAGATGRGQLPPRRSGSAPVRSLFALAVLVAAALATLTSVGPVRGSHGSLTHLLSGPAGTPDGESYDPAISRDGRYTAFTSVSTTFGSPDGDGLASVFVTDNDTHAIVRISSNPNHQLLNGPSYEASISADGRYVAFVSEATDLVGGDTNGVADVFVIDRDFDEDGTYDEVNGHIATRVSVDSAEGLADGASDRPRISADGRFVAFRSVATDLVSGDTNGWTDTFVRDLELGTTERVSLGNDGLQGVPLVGDTVAEGFAVSISDDGRYVGFDTAAGFDGAGGHARPPTSTCATARPGP